MILPNLAECVAKLQDMLRPEDERFGQGIADWTITAEYVDGLSVDGAEVWGCMGSPSSSGLTKLTPEDVATRRAHIAIRTPRSPAELAELWRTLFHEGGHVLVAGLNLPRDAEEEVMHSIDHAFAKLTPEQASALARGIRNPMARAYRAPAKEGDMPPETEEKDKKEPDKPPMAQDGATMPVEEIKAKLVEAVLAGQPTEEIAAQLVKAMAMASAAPPPAPTPPAEMGMKPEDVAYARGKKAAEAEAEQKLVKTYAETLEGLDEEQRAQVRDMPTLARAQALAKTYKKPAPAAPEKQTMGMHAHPAKGEEGKKQSAMARACALPSDPMARQAMGYVDTSAESGGIELDNPGYLVVLDLHTRAAEQKAAYKARNTRGAA